MFKFGFKFYVIRRNNGISFAHRGIPLQTPSFFHFPEVNTNSHKKTLNNEYILLDIFDIKIIKTII
jgi:hypothetical protein